MAKVKVEVRYPTAFAGLGFGDVAGGDVVEIDEELAVSLASEGWADLVKPKRAKVTETATVKLKDRDS
jgi:hypothetical protein